jgi:hypothetical protein
MTLVTFAIELALTLNFNIPVKLLHIEHEKETTEEWKITRFPGLERKTLNFESFTRRVSLSWKLHHILRIIDLLLY